MIKKLTFKVEVIEVGTGTINVLVVHDEGKDIIIFTSRELVEAAPYFVTEQNYINNL